MSHEDFERGELGEALCDKNLPEAVEETAPSKSVPVITYSIDLGKRISDLYAQGKSLHAIAQCGEMPAYSTLIRWAKEHPEMSKMLRAVREARALHFENAAISAAEEASGKDGDRLRFEAYKWGAEVNDPSTYGKKVTHAGDAGNPVVLQVVTGFGEPNKWQTPPKLKADGTIDKTPLHVESEVVNDRSAASPETSRDSSTGSGKETAGESNEA